MINCILKHDEVMNKKIEWKKEKEKKKERKKDGRININNIILII